MMAMASQMHEKFSTVRKKLDQLGFRQPLGVDSLPLVERLLSDLMWTTEGLRKSKAELERRVEIRGKAEQCIAPYKQDNARLVKENSQLHQRILHLQQSHDEELRDLRATLRKAQSASDDLKFFNSHCLQKLRESEQEMKLMVENIIQLQEKNFQAVVHTPGGRKKSIPFRRQRMDIDCLVPPSVEEEHQDTGEKRLCCVVAAHWTWLRDTRPDGEQGNITASVFLDSVSRRCEQLQCELHHAQEELQLSEHKVANFRRNCELRDQEIERLNHLLEGGRSLEALSVETRYRDNERVVSQLQLQADLLRQKSEELQRQLDKSLGQLSEARGREMDLEEQLKRAQAHVSGQSQGSRVSEANRAQQQVQERDDFHREISRLREEISRREHDLANADLERTQQQLLLDDLRKDNERLQQRLDQFATRERELVLELDRLQPPVGQASKKPSQNVEKYLKRVEQERDYWKQEAELLAQVKSKRQALKPDKSSATAKGTDDRLVNLQLQKRVQTLEQELSECKKQNAENVSKCEHCEEQLKHVQRLTQQRDNLQTLLNKFEQQLCEIQDNIAKITKERDHFQQMYQECRSQLLNAQQELLSSRVSSRTEPQPSGNAAALKQAEADRQTALADAQQSREEVASLKERLREKDLAAGQWEKKLELIVREREALRVQCGKLAQELEKLVPPPERPEQQNDLALQLSRLKTAVVEAEERAHLAEARLKLVETELGKAREEQIRVRSLLLQVEAEKDALHAQVDERTEQSHAMQRDLTMKERALSECKVALGAVEQRVARGEEAAAVRDRELNTLRNQVDLLQTELEQERRRAEQARKDAARLQEDLSTMTQEAQSLQTELQEAASEGEECRMRAQVLLVEKQRLEQSAVDKEQEKRAQLEQYRLLALEAERYQSEMRRLESDLSAARLELLSLRGTAQVLQANQHQVQELQEQVHTLTRQLNAREKALEDTEQQLVQRSAQQEDWLRDLTALRDLCSQRETALESLQRQLAAAHVDRTEAEAQAQETRRLLEQVHTQVRSEQENTRHLEAILSASREQQCQSQLELQERNAELLVARDSLELHLVKTEQLERDATRWKARAVELESDVEGLNRMLTSEKFDKERALQDLRRVQHQLSLFESARSYKSSSHVPPLFPALSRSPREHTAHQESLSPPLSEDYQGPLLSEGPLSNEMSEEVPSSLPTPPGAVAL